METQIGVVNKATYSTLTWPHEWQSGFIDIIRDDIAYKQLHFFIGELATDTMLNQFDQLFNNETDYKVWLDSTDAPLTDLRPISISNHPDNPTFTRTATCLKQCINYNKNSMDMCIEVKTYKGTSEQITLYKKVDRSISSAYYGIYMSELNRNEVGIETLLNHTIQDIDKHKGFD